MSGETSTRRRSCSATAAWTSRRTFDLLAPVLADAGWRVVAWDQRGHGDSDYAALYSWDADVRDALAVLDSTTRAPVPVVGHSKGGGLMMQLAEAMPHRVSHLANLDGLPSKRLPPDVAEPRAHPAAREGPRGLARPPAAQRATRSAGRARSTSSPSGERA